MIYESIGSVNVGVYLKPTDVAHAKGNVICMFFVRMQVADWSWKTLLNNMKVGVCVASFLSQ